MAATWSEFLRGVDQPPASDILRRAAEDFFKGHGYPTPAAAESLTEDAIAVLSPPSGPAGEFLRRSLRAVQANAAKRRRLDGAGDLTAEQQGALTMFMEVMGDAVNANHAKELLRSCNWNAEQAMQLHFASEEGGAVGPGPAAAGSSSGLAPARPRIPSESQQVLIDAGGGLVSSGVFGWLERGLRWLGTTILNLICTFLGVGWMGRGPGSGEAFARALSTAYGADLRLPRFFEGAFAAAVQAARRDLKLLAVYIHSDHSRHARDFVTNVLCNEFVRSMLDEHFVLWGGDIARMESHQVAQMVHARQYPCFCVLLPASAEEIRVIGAVAGQIQVDNVVAILTSCLDEMETHRTEIVARREQHSEDRLLREQQDRELKESEAMDRAREEERQQALREAKEKEREVEEQQRKMETERAAIISRRQTLSDERKIQAATLEPEGPDATARVALRLPAGQRIQRRFRPEAKLSDIYSWAHCAQHLPDNDGKNLEIPERFVLKTSFPCRELHEMDRTISELQLAGSNILLAQVEDDE